MRLTAIKTFKNESLNFCSRDKNGIDQHYPTSTHTRVDTQVHTLALEVPRRAGGGRDGKVSRARAWQTPVTLSYKPPPPPGAQKHPRVRDSTAWAGRGLPRSKGTHTSRRNFPTGWVLAQSGRRRPDPAPRMGRRKTRRAVWPGWTDSSGTNALDSAFSAPGKLRSGWDTGWAEGPLAFWVFF